MAGEILSIVDVRASDSSWVASLVPMLAVFESGTPKGRSLAKQNLQRMAELADLAIDAVMTIERIVTEEHVRGADVRMVMAEAQRLSTARPADNSPDGHAAASSNGQVVTVCGVLAKTLSNLELPLDVCYCVQGFYIGTFCDAQPYTRESNEYWPHRHDAALALKTGAWTQRAQA